MDLVSQYRYIVVTTPSPAAQMENHWRAFRDSVIDTSLSFLGKPAGKH